MRKVSAAKEKAITAAADALLLEGTDSPTNDQVRNYMGGGSIADISPVMRRWREKRREELLVTENIPVDVRNASDQFLHRLWVVASRDAGAALEKQRDETKQLIETLQTEQEEALEEIRTLENKVSNAEKEARHAQNNLKTLETKLAESDAKLQAALIERERFATLAEEGLSSKEDLSAQFARTQNELKELQKELVKIAGRS